MYVDFTVVGGTDPYTLRKCQATSDSQKQQPPLDLPSAAGREPGVQDQEERKDNETIAERPPEVHTEHGSEGGQGLYEGTPSGECWCPWLHHSLC